MKIMFLIMEAYEGTCESNFIIHNKNLNFLKKKFFFDVVKTEENFKEEKKMKEN